MLNQENLENAYANIQLLSKEGGTALVYKAYHKRLQKIVVLKKIKFSGVSLEQQRKEVDILKNLRHSYLPQVFDFIEVEDGIYTAMDYIPGKSLQNMLEEKHIFTEKEVLKYARQLCEVLAYLHTQNPPIVHADIKPDNIMVTPEGNICLIDFNISGIINGQKIQITGYTPNYAAPEQIKAYHMLLKAIQTERESKNKNQSMTKTILLSEEIQLLEETQALLETEVIQELQTSQKTQEIQETSLLSKIPAVDRRSDVYSIGATLYALLAGSPLKKSPVPELTNVSDGFQLILRKALEQNPDKRYQDAEKMYQAILQVHKKDRQYQRLLWKQNLILIMLLIICSSSVLFLFEGWKKIRTEKQEQYTSLVEQLEIGANEGMEESFFEKLYDEAVVLYPDFLDAYYEKANYLFETGQYEDVISFIKEKSSYSLEGTDILWGNWYYLYAESYFRLGEYEKACTYYQTALQYNNNPYVYRDYAISLVYLERILEAQILLKEAEKAGMEQADIRMVQGEVERMSGQFEKAIACLSQVLELSEEEYLLQRAYLSASEAFSEIGTEEALLTDVKWLQEGIKKLSLNNRLFLYERLEQDYIQLGDRLQEEQYYKNAVQVLEEIKTMDWDTQLTYSNAIILCQRIHDLERAERWAEEMLKQYPDSYQTYMRLAYLELEKQNVVETEERDYTTFAQYYEEAEIRYQEQLSGNKTDAEMQRLKKAYLEVVSGGWLEE